VLKSFQPVKKVSATVQVANRIRSAIAGGDFQPGDALPSERDLAKQMGVNRSTIREALHRLEAGGLVLLRQGGATRVADFLVTTGLQMLPMLIAPGGMTDPALLRDLMQMRSMLLGWTIRQVAREASAEAVEALTPIVERMVKNKERGATPQELQLVDLEFFEAMIRLTNNRILAILTSAMRQVYLQNKDLFGALYTDESFDPQHHQTAVEALGRGDAEAAGRAMEIHASAGLGADWATGVGRQATEE